MVLGLDPVRRGLHVCEHRRHCGKCSDLLIRSPYSASARPLTRPLARPIFTDFSDFLGRLRPRQNLTPEASRDSGSRRIEFSRIDFPPLLRKGGKWILDVEVSQESLKNR